MRAEKRAAEKADPKSKPKEKQYQAWTGAGNGPLAAPLVHKIILVIETLCLNLHKYMNRPADGEKTELEKSADPDTRTEALLVEFCKGVANEGMPEPEDTDEDQADAIYECRWQRSLAPEEGEAHGMMNNEEDGNTKTVPMLLKNIQFQGSQPRNAAEAAKRLEDALRRGADAAGIQTKRGPIAEDVQIFAPGTMRTHDPQGKGVGWTAKAGIAHEVARPLWNRMSKVYNSKTDKWETTDQGKILVTTMTNQLGKDFMVLPVYHGVAEKRTMEIKVDTRQLAEESGGDGEDEWLPLMAEGASRALGSMMQLGSIGGATEAALVEDFRQQLQANGIPVHEVHVMPVMKFEKPENAMSTYGSGGGGGGDRNSSRGGGRGGGGRGGGRGTYVNAPTIRHERANMQGCHSLQRIFVVLTNDTGAHEMERKLQAGEEEGNYLTLSMKKGGVKIQIPVVLNAVKTDDRRTYNSNVSIVPRRIPTLQIAEPVDKDTVGMVEIEMGGGGGPNDKSGYYGPRGNVFWAAQKQNMVFTYSPNISMTGFKNELKASVQNNVNQWAQSDPGLVEWAKENGPLKVLEVVLLRPPQDLWAGKFFALVVKNKAHAQALEHLLSRGAMPIESDVVAAVNTKEIITTLAILPDRSYTQLLPPPPFLVKGTFLVISDKDTGLLDMQTAMRIPVLNQEQRNKKDAAGSDLAKQMLDSLSVSSRPRGGTRIEGAVVNGRLSKEQEEKVVTDMLPWLFDKCNEFEKIHQGEKAALEAQLTAGLEREEKTQSAMQDLKERLEKTEDFIRNIKSKDSSGKAGAPDAKKRRGEATASDSDKSAPTSEANDNVGKDAEGDAKMRQE